MDIGKKSVSLQGEEYGPSAWNNATPASSNKQKRNAMTGIEHLAMYVEDLEKARDCTLSNESAKEFLRIKE